MLYPKAFTLESEHTPTLDSSTPTVTLAAADIVTLADEAKQAQHQDPDFPDMIQRLETIHEEGPQHTGDVAFAQNYMVQDGYLWRRAATPQLWVPPAVRTRVLHEFHDAEDAGHPGQEETVRAIKNHYAWPSITNDVQKHIRACLIYATTKRGRRQPKAPTRAYVPRRPWQTIALDYMGPYEETPTGNKFLFVVTDIFSKWVEAFPVPRATVQATLRLLENEVFSRWGYPQAIISDNRTQFTSEAFQKACRRWKTRQWLTAVAHPRANPTERRNQELKKLMRILTQNRPEKPWDEAVPKGLFNLRKRRNAATGQTPSHLLLGFEITRPDHWDLDIEAVNSDAQQRYQLARDNADQYRQRYTGDDQEAPTYQLEDRVLLRRHTPAGLKAKWLGPFDIVGIAGEQCYRVDQRTHVSTEHVDHLRPAPEAPTYRRVTTATQVEPGDETPIQATIGRISEDDVANYDNATLHRIRARQMEAQERRRRRQIISAPSTSARSAQGSTEESEPEETPTDSNEDPQGTEREPGEDQDICADRLTRRPKDTWKVAIAPKLQGDADKWWTEPKDFLAPFEEFRRSFLRRFADPLLLQDLHKDLVQRLQAAKERTEAFVCRKRLLAKRLMAGATECEIVDLCVGL